MSPKEAALYLGIAPSTLFKWLRDGNIPHVGGGTNQQRYIRRSDLEAIAGR
jgi:excisionase family DNA binding protein